MEVTAWLVLAVTAVVTVAMRASNKRTQPIASRTLERWARAHGARYRGSTLADGSARAFGRHGGVNFVVQFYRTGGSTRTRVVAHVARGSGPKIVVKPRGAPAASPRAFADVYDVEGEDIDAIVAAIGSRMLELAARGGAWLVADGAKVTVSWFGVEVDERVLGAARDVATQVAAFHTPVEPYR